MRFNNEFVMPERGLTETLPWGAIRVANRNRPDTVGNPSVYNCEFRLVGQSMVDWFGRWWVTIAQEGSVPVETGLGWAQVLGAPRYGNNTGRRASVTMQLEIETDADFENDCGLLAVGEYFGDEFDAALVVLRRGIG